MVGRCRSNLICPMATIKARAESDVPPSVLLLAQAGDVFWLDTCDDDDDDDDVERTAMATNRAAQSERPA